MAKQKQRIEVQGKAIRIEMLNGQEYICITDIAKSGRSNPSDIIKNYLRNRSNIEFLGLWEELNNGDFN